MPKLHPSRLLAACLSSLLSLPLIAVPAGAAEFTRGDCNADGNVVAGTPCDISDAIFLLNYLFLGGGAPPCVEACDVNDDASVDIADAVYELSFCFAGGPRPPAPFPGCGEDLTGLPLGCGEFSPCTHAAGCEPQDARGVGLCEAIVGIFWDGFRCRYHSGCSCEGEDCDESYTSLEECYRAHLGCDSACEPMDARGVGPCLAILGYLWGGRLCQAISGCECEGEDCDRLFDSAEECQAAVLGCPLDCAPMDVRGVGPCDAVLGSYWDGFRCVELPGCECEGEDCDRLFPSLGHCRIAYQSCPPTCVPMDARGVGPCDAVLGYAWNGSRCVSISGCECEGSDCERLASLEVCEAAHARCPAACKPMDARGVGDCEAVRGYYWDGRQCQPLVGCDCEGEDCDQLFESQRECALVNAGCPPLCEPMEVEAVGPCALLLGYYWDGSRCASLSGCSCEGPDCDRLFASEEACREVMRGCE
jgi:hypothetical protein